MTEYFWENGFLEPALANVKYYLDIIYKFIPVTGFISNVPNHCWRTDLKVVFGKSVIEGRFGAINVSFQVKPNDSDFQQLNCITNSGNLVKDLHRLSNQRIIKDLTVACIPSIFLAGFPKCGSTFLNYLLKSHPRIVEAKQKEPHWWVFNKHFTNDTARNAMFLANYLLNYELLKQGTLYQSKLSVDATPSIMFDWPDFLPSSNSRNHEINFCLLPSVIPKVLPKTRFIVVMRNPVNLLYSSFWFSCTHRQGVVPMETQLKGPGIFHERITQKIRIFNACIETFPLAKCVLDAAHTLLTPDLQKCGRTRLEMGIYYTHVQKWLSVVPQSKFLFLTLEELSVHTNTVMRRVWQFLDIKAPSGNLQVSDKSVHQQETVDYRNDPRLAMRNDTRELLERFFQPYNKLLASLIGDDKFLWNDK